MLRTSLFAAAAALAIASCAGHTGESATSSAAAASAPPPPATSSSPAPEATTPPPSTAPGATPSAPATYTDAQLRAFAAASHDIQPLQAQLTSGTPEQRTAATTQIRAILQRNNLDGATYNAIATQAHSDPAFAARIAALAPPG